MVQNIFTAIGLILFLSGFITIGVAMTKDETDPQRAPLGMTGFAMFLAAALVLLVIVIRTTLSAGS